MNQIRLSPSRITDFNNCPQLYKYRVVDQLPEQISIDAERGKLVHSVLEKLFDSPQGLRNLDLALSLIPTLWEIQKEEVPGLEALITSQKEWDDRVAALLATYFLLEEPNSFDATHREMHVELNLSENIYVHGYVDRMDIAPTGEVRIVDYKTGKAPQPRWQGKALSQLKIYALVYWRNTGVIPRLLQLIYLGSSEVVRSAPTADDLIETEVGLFEVATSILSSTQENSWPPHPSRLCDWCSFKSICPAFSS